METVAQPPMVSGTVAADVAMGCKRRSALSMLCASLLWLNPSASSQAGSVSREVMAAFNKAFAAASFEVRTG